MTKQMTLPRRMVLIAAVVALAFSAALATQAGDSAEARPLDFPTPFGSTWS